MSRRKKILVHSNSHSAFTGFGKNCKNILKYLYSTDKYELFELANGVLWSENDHSTPWGFLGSLPDDQTTLASLKNDQALSRRASYGLLTVDKAIEKIKPDIYLGIEDIWAFSETVGRTWWNKMNCMIWTTLDSLPILPDAINLAPKIKNYYVWSSFAEKAMKKIGINHVKTLHGSIDETNFHRLEDSERSNLRKKFNIDQDSFIIGFVFRNQLRKTVSDLIVGFKLFKSKYPESSAKLLLHTNWGEGWDIPRLMSENGVDKQDVLTTYHCANCKNYSINPFVGLSVKCPFCGKEGAFSTTSIVNGVSETQLNEVYNLMDMYVHPFTSGGQEIPIQEAKLTELITAVTNYTCGEEMCSKESGGLPLLWAPYREIGTQFIKASTSPKDIFEKITAVYLTKPEIKKEMEKLARKYVIDNYSFSSIGKKLEAIFDEMPFCDYEYSAIPEKPNPLYSPKSQYKTHADFVNDLYGNILAREPDPQGFEHWMSKLQRGEDPKKIVAYFRQVAKKDLAEKFPQKVSDFIDPDDKSKKIALVVPTDIHISLLFGCFIDSIRQEYPDYKLYVFADKSVQKTFFPYIDKIHKLCPLVKDCDNQSYMEGKGDHRGFVDICFIVGREHLNLVTYSHNAKDKN